MDGTESPSECHPFELYNSIVTHRANPAVGVAECNCTANDNDSFVSYDSSSSEAASRLAGHTTADNDRSSFYGTCNQPCSNGSDSGNWSLLQLNQCGLPMVAAAAVAAMTGDPNGHYRDYILHRRSMDIASPNLYGPFPYKSPHRYVESDVNIHYRTPIRYEYKDPISDAELIYRQEQMKKLYQEERRRKYLLELQDMNNRRHTDNFTPSQKSPIPLNRYDEFGTDYASVDYLNTPRTMARGLYNFQGQTARELSFKKGDIIYIRREIDKNWYEGEHNAMVGLLPSIYVELISKDGVRIPPQKPADGQARAKFNFQAQSAIELSLNKGELVVLTRRVDDNWFEGRIANRKGIFPVSYVEVLTDIGSESIPIIPVKPIGAPAAHSLIASPPSDYQQTNYSSDIITSNGHHTPNNNNNNNSSINNNIIKNNCSNGVLRETKSVQKTDVLHVDINSDPIPYRAVYKYRPQNSDELELNDGDTVYVLEKCDDGWFVGTSQRTGFFGTFPGNYVERI